MRKSTTILLLAFGSGRGRCRRAAALRGGDALRLDDGTRHDG